MITIALNVSNVRIRLVLIDCAQGKIVMKKDVVSPNPSTFKTYFSEPYFCLIYSRSKLLLLDIRSLLTGSCAPNVVAFQEIETVLNLK
jgi:hypothetical protein